MQFQAFGDGPCKLSSPQQSEGDCITPATSAPLGLPQLPMMPLVGKPLDQLSPGAREALIAARGLSGCWPGPYVRGQR